MKKTLTIELESILYEFDGLSLKESISFLESIPERHKEYTNFKLEVVVKYHEYEERSLCLYGDRLETDEEEQERELLEQQSKKYNELYETKKAVCRD